MVVSTTVQEVGEVLTIPLKMEEDLLVAGLGVLPGERQRSLFVQRERGVGVAPLADVFTNIVDVLVDFSFGASAAAPQVFLLSLIELVKISSVFLGE